MESIVAGSTALDTALVKSKIFRQFSDPSEISHHDEAGVDVFICVSFEADLGVKRLCV